jgi:phage terminase large subunit GpA-like protein
VSFTAASPIVTSAAEAYRPPRRVSVSDGVANILMIRQPGGYSGPWSAAETPYMVEPMDMLASRQHEAICFVGPARSGKTMGLLDGWLGNIIVNDPGDILIVQMTQEKAREFSKIRVDRAIRHSPEIKSRMSLRGHDDNTHDKLTKHGMWIKIGWPSATQLASSDYRYVALTDYDRMPDNIDGEGAAYVLAVKRTQTFLSRGMCMVESSPGREYDDPHWRASTAHEAPPASGILGIYNRSDRRRWYWCCPDCFEYFEAAPGLALFATLPDEEELFDEIRSAPLSKLAKKHAVVCCPHCGSQITHEHKQTLNNYKTARWLADGQRVEDGEVVGDYEPSSIAGYWLGGVAAAYQKWDSIILRYLQGLREYALSGSDLTLKTTINTDQSMPYLPRHLKDEAGDLAESRLEGLQRYHVPPWARFLLAAVDVQGGRRARFVVQVHAIGPHMESAVIDRYDITESPRGENERIDPAAYPEDWDVITEKVVKGTYKIDDDDEQELRVLNTIVDYGGEAGVSAQAADWRRRVKSQGFGNRITLGKGDGLLKEMVQRTTARNTEGKRMNDVPLLLFSSDKFKDQIAAAMRRPEPGPTYMHFPSWLKQWFFDEIRAEVRQKSGKWKKIRARNEALDCWCMIWALAYSLGPADTRRKFNWENPPAWAKPIEHNSQLISKDDRRAIKAAPKKSQPRPNKTPFVPRKSGFIKGRR